MCAVRLQVQFSVGLQDNFAQSLTDNTCILRVFNMHRFLPGPGC